MCDLRLDKIICSGNVSDTWFNRSNTFNRPRCEALISGKTICMNAMLWQVQKGIHAERRPLSRLEPIANYLIGSV